MFHLPDPPSFKVVGEMVGGTRPLYPVVTGASESGTTVTITTASATGLSVGEVVDMEGFSPGGYNGLYFVTGVGANSFTYTAAGGLGAVWTMGISMIRSTRAKPHWTWSGPMRWPWRQHRAH